MKDFPNQRDYIKSKGFDPSINSEEISILKREYRRLYLKEYRSRNKTEQRSLTIRFTPEEYMRLNSEKNKHAYSLSRFIVFSSLAYIDNEYLNPQQELVQELIKEVRRIGTNVNQIVVKLHHQMRFRSAKGDWEDSVKKLSRILDGYELLLQRIEDMESKITEYANVPPPKLLKLNWENLKNNRTQLKEVISYLLKRLEDLEKNER